MFPLERMQTCWSSWPAVVCPVCLHETLVSPASECTRCGKWWENFAMPVPAGPYIEAARLLPQLSYAIGGALDTVLFVGGGDGIVGQNNWQYSKLHSIDIWPAVHPAPSFTQGDARDLLQIYGPASFDAIVCCDMIEHVSKEDGTRLLREVFPGCARKWIVLTTPNGFLEQDPEKCPDEPWAKNPHQKHICGWLYEEFLAEGYSVYMNGINEAGELGGAYVTAFRKLP